MFTKQIALVSQTNRISFEDLSLVAAALQKQATRDFGPIWGIQATVDVFAGIHNVPLGYWPVIICDTINMPGAEGYHWSDENNIPFALVRYDSSWPLTCSHEICEMLADPYGNKTQTADSIIPGQGRVNYLVEVCDPCEGAAFSYRINGIMVSDFYTPHYFDPVINSSVRYSFTGSIKQPRQILKDGYLSWFDPTQSRWFQANYFGPAPEVRDITQQMANNNGPVRSKVDRVTQNPNKTESVEKALMAHAKAGAEFDRSAKAYQTSLMKEFDRYCK